MTDDLLDDDLIPPDELIELVNVGGGDFQHIGDGLITRFFDRGWVGLDDTFLDIGCGLGRMARPLVPRLSAKGRYLGFDINKTSIDWCREKYRSQPNFQFEWINLQSVFYNPDGTDNADRFRFPVPDASVDFANLASVFTHMLGKGVRNYLQEVGRMLKSGKRCYITYFLIDPLSRLAFDRSAQQGKWHPIEDGYVQDIATPERVVLLYEDIVRSYYIEAGLRIVRTNYGNWCNHVRGDISKGGYQDEIVAVKA